MIVLNINASPELAILAETADYETTTCNCGEPLDRDPNDQPYCPACDGCPWGDNGGLPNIAA